MSEQDNQSSKSQNIKVICGMTMSLDGFVAGLNMTESRPFGDVDDDKILHWMFQDPNEIEKDLPGFREKRGAYIMGRNMYGPAGDKYDKSWKGWWGPNPPWHAPVFVLTHRPRESIEMEGGTTFHFITEGIEEALKQAKEVAGDKHVVIAGGANTVDQYLAAKLIDTFWLHIYPGTFGTGVRLFDKIPNLEMEPITVSGNNLVTHIKYRLIK